MTVLSHQVRRTKRQLRVTPERKLQYRINRSPEGYLRPHITRGSSPLVRQVIRLMNLIQTLSCPTSNRRLIRYIVWCVYPRFLLSKKIKGVMKNFLWYNYRYAKLLLKLRIHYGQYSDGLLPTVTRFQYKSDAIAPLMLSYIRVSQGDSPGDS